MASNPYQPPQHDTDPPRGSSDGYLTGRELFGVIIRVIGLCIVLYSVWSMAGAVYPAEGYGIADYFVGSTPILLMGLWLLLGANSIVRLSYGRERPPHDR